MRADDVVRPLEREAPRHRRVLRLERARHGQRREEVYERERVVEVAERVRKARVPLLDEVVERERRALRVQAPRRVHFLPPDEPLQATHEDHLVAELAHQRLVREELNVLVVVVRLLPVEPGLGLRVAAGDGGVGCGVLGRAGRFQNPARARMQRKDTPRRSAAVETHG